MYRLDEVRHDHCPGGCYVFAEELRNERGWLISFTKVHVPKQLFHGGMPWFWATTYSGDRNPFH